jgi:hypothetical protein
MSDPTPITTLAARRERQDVLALHHYQPQIHLHECCDLCGHGVPLSAHNVHCRRFHRAVRAGMVCTAYVSPVDQSSIPAMQTINPAWDADQDQLAAPLSAPAEAVQAQRKAATKAAAERAADLDPKPSALISLRERRAIVRTLALAFIGLVLLMGYGLWVGARAQDGTQPSGADQLRVVAHQLSYHLDRKQGFREVNPGLGVQWRLQGDARAYLQGGTYLNSVERRTWYLATGAEPLAVASGRFTVGGFVGLATGYRATRRTVLRSVDECTLPAGASMLVCQRVTTRETLTVRNGGAIPMAGMSASWHVTPRFALHLAATPDVSWRGNRNYAALGLMASVGF